MGLLIGVGHVGHRGQSDTVGTCKLHRVLHPAFYGVGHGLHIQSCDHCRARLIEKTTERTDSKLEQIKVENIKNWKCVLLQVTGDCQLNAVYAKWF